MEPGKLYACSRTVSPLGCPRLCRVFLESCISYQLGHYGTIEELWSNVLHVQHEELNSRENTDVCT